MQENLSLYHVFYVVGKTGNISKAAKELFISQPAVSRAVQKLEASLNVSLFKRNSRGVILTPAGELLFQKLKGAFSLISEGEELLLHSPLSFCSSSSSRHQLHTLQVCASFLPEALYILSSPGPRQYFLPVYLSDASASR